MRAPLLGRPSTCMYMWSLMARQRLPGAPVVPRSAVMCRCAHIYKRHSKSIDTDRMACSQCSGRLMFRGRFQPDGTPAKARAPSAFANFVKEQFADVKAAHPAGLPRHCSQHPTSCSRRGEGPSESTRHCRGSQNRMSVLVSSAPATMPCPFLVGSSIHLCRGLFNDLSVLPTACQNISCLNAGTPHKALMTALSAKWRLQKAAAEASTASGCTDLSRKMEQLRLQAACR